ncbi:AEL098Wp [Eremothecium gossypii ATCC 10895]|uniref:AEL098Wp n=1 Tax=Eremothecium gossypii (strain ATCC 10895 / CBS 109.51 / FGSC 9923 / NRRL Y-1056) TaxID=284811 RepID=Q757W0_EREGS|nr:AEL098Wp [Eremothecium gossypii ATCC 10895]AAS52587.2 AEL098Wp [Eremothecium gossypii ATCC 10895]
MTSFLYSGKRFIAKAAGRSTNPQMSFPCLDKLDALTAKLKENRIGSINGGSTVGDFYGTLADNEPVYGNVKSGYQLYSCEEPLLLDYGGVLLGFRIAYETWGTLNAERSNAVLLHTGLSASSHARSSELNGIPGWWEKFIGPGSKILDTNRFFVVCTNVLGGCYGSTGPSSADPADGEPYATRFPILSIQDIVRAQHKLVRECFGIEKLYASVGSSMGGMQSLAYGQLFPSDVEKIVSISACAQSDPSSIALRHAQRQVLMADVNWNRGLYYPSEKYPDRIPPHVGMKLAREIATVTYRSGPEWESRFGTERLDPDGTPTLCPDFLVESYLNHQGEKFSLEYDANSFLYLSKTMDLFDLSASHLRRSQQKRMEAAVRLKRGTLSNTSSVYAEPPTKKKSRTISIEENHRDLVEGMAPLRDKDILIIGVQSDALFPAAQQRKIVELLGNSRGVHYIELTQEQSIFGHDTFLLDTEHIGLPIGKFLSGT